MICDFDFAKESEDESHSSHGMGFECSLLIYIFFYFLKKDCLITDCQEWKAGVPAKQKL